MMQWTRAHRGRVWHITFGDGPILCNSELIGWEFIIGMPPRGGVPCQPCVAAIAEAHTYAGAAVQAAEQAEEIRRGRAFEETADGAVAVPLSADWVDMGEGAPMTEADISE